MKKSQIHKDRTEKKTPTHLRKMTSRRWRAPDWRAQRKSQPRQGGRWMLQKEGRGPSTEPGRGSGEARDWNGTRSAGGKNQPPTKNQPKRQHVAHERTPFFQIRQTQLQLRILYLVKLQAKSTTAFSSKRGLEAHTFSRGHYRMCYSKRGSKLRGKVMAWHVPKGP